MVIDTSSETVSYLELLTGRRRRMRTSVRESLMSGRDSLIKGVRISRGVSIPTYIRPATPERGKRRGRLFACAGTDIPKGTQCALETYSKVLFSDVRCSASGHARKRP